MSARPQLGFGVGLRPKHYRDFLEGSPSVDWVEAISENFMGVGGRPFAVLERVRRDRPVVLHGVSLGIGSAAPLDERYLRDWKALIDQVQPALVSDHLCWGRAHGRYSHDLLPLPFTEASLDHVVARVGQAQDFLGRQLMLENVSSYLTWAHSELSEWDFLAEVSKRADCLLLLDVNNVYVSSRNHGFDPDAYLSAIPVDRVAQFHLAGHQRRPELIIDTHDGPVSDEVWALYARALGRFGQVPTLIEWDDAVPPLDVLLAEAQKARAFAATAHRTGEPVSPPVAGPRALEGPPLASAQATVFDAVCNPEAVTPEAEALIAAHPPLSGKQRLEVYAEMYWLRMRDVLRDAFPAVSAGLGADFEPVVADFLRAHPSTSPSLDALGARFPGFVRASRPAWADLAALEWARGQSFIALDGPVVDFAALQAHPPESWPEVSLRAHPSVRVLELAFDPLPALRAQRDGKQVPAPLEAPTALVVWRSGFEVFHAPIDSKEAAALRVLLPGASLPEVLAPFEELEDGGVAAFEALSSWFSEGMVSSIWVGSAAPRDERADR